MSTIKYSSNKTNKNIRMIVNLLIIYLYCIVAFVMSYLLTYENLKVTSFYCSVMLVAVLFASFAELTQRNILLYNFFMFLSFFTLFFVYGFRNFSAIDDPSYIRIFEQISYVGWFEYFKFSTMEPGYLILNKIVSLFTDNYLYMQLITSFIPLFLFYYGFNKYKKIISLPTAVFLLCSILYFQMLSVALVRMFIAIGIVFVAISYIPERKPIKYMFLIAVASMFHYSAFFMAILTYFAINKSNLTKKTIRFYTLVFLTSPLIFIFIGRFIVPLLGSRYKNYGSIDSINLSIESFTTLPLIILLLFFYKRFDESEKAYFKIFIFIYSLSIIISMFGDMINLGRLVFYSYSAFILGAAMVTKKIRLNSNKIVFSSIIILYGFLYLFYTQFLNVHHIPNLFPYKNIFFNL